MKTESSIYIPLIGSCVVAAVSLTIGILNFLNPRLIETRKNKYNFLYTDLLAINKLREALSNCLKAIAIINFKISLGNSNDLNSLQKEVLEVFFTISIELRLKKTLLVRLENHEAIKTLLDEIKEYNSFSTSDLRKNYEIYFKILDILDIETIKIENQIEEYSSWF